MDSRKIFRRAQVGYKTSIPGVFGGRWVHRVPLRGVCEIFLKTIESKPNKKSKKITQKFFPKNRYQGVSQSCSARLRQQKWTIQTHSFSKHPKKFESGKYKYIFGSTKVDGKSEKIRSWPKAALSAGLCPSTLRYRVELVWRTATRIC